MDLIERLRLLEQDHEPDGWPAVRMRDITALLDALEAAREEAARQESLKEQRIFQCDGLEHRALAAEARAERLAEAMEWNWLDDDARPSRIADLCDRALLREQKKQVGR